MIITTNYSLETGMFCNGTLTCSGEFLNQNVPEGFSCLIGEYDHLSQKVDLETNQVVDYQPVAPSVNYEWNEVTKRWVYVPTDEDIARQVRQKRDALLTASDWVTLRAFRTGTPIPEAWATYQTALADLPLQEGFPREIIWPELPEQTTNKE